MSKEIPPYKCAISLNHGILNLASDIAYDLGVLDNSGFFPLDADKIIGVKTVVEISGGHLTPSQFKGLSLGETIPNQPIANNFAKIYGKLPRLDPFDRAFLTMYEENYFLDGVPSRMGRKATDFPFALPLTPKIDQLLTGLFTFIKRSYGKMHPLLLSGMALIEILAIAPYSNGNMPLALLLSKAILCRYDKSFLYVPFEENLMKHHDGLIASVEASIKVGEFSPFIAFYLGILASSLKSLLRRKGKKDKETSIQVRRLLEVMEEGRYYGANELCEILGLKSRLGLMKNYLNPALSAGLIKRSDPTSPTSRNQRYGKVA